MTCIWTEETGAGAKKETLERARIIITSCDPAKGFHVIIEYCNSEGEQRQGGYYETVTAHYDAPKDITLLVTINSPIPHLKGNRNA